MTKKIINNKLSAIHVLLLFIVMETIINITYAKDAGHELRFFDSKIINYFVNSGQPGILSAYKANPSHKASTSQMYLYVGNDRKLKGKFLIGNYIGTDVNYRIFVLLDYVQTKFTWEGKERNYADIEILKNTNEFRDIVIGELKEGMHDVLIMAKRLSPADVDYKILFHRANIVVENTEKVNVKIKYIRGKTINIDTEEDFAIKRSRAEHEHSISLEIANLNQIPISYKVVLFNNNRQVAITPPKNSIANVFELNSETKVIIDTGIPDDAQQIWGLMIENPYLILEDSPGQMTRRSIRLYYAELESSE